MFFLSSCSPPGRVIPTQPTSCPFSQPLPFLHLHLRLATRGPTVLAPSCLTRGARPLPSCVRCVGLGPSHSTPCLSRGARPLHQLHCCAGLGPLHHQQMLRGARPLSISNTIARGSAPSISNTVARGLAPLHHQHRCAGLGSSPLPTPMCGARPSPSPTRGAWPLSTTNTVARGLAPLHHQHRLLRGARPLSITITAARGLAPSITNSAARGSAPLHLHHQHCCVGADSPPTPTLHGARPPPPPTISLALRILDAPLPQLRLQLVRPPLSFVVLSRVAPLADSQKQGETLANFFCGGDSTPHLSPTTHLHILHQPLNSTNFFCPTSTSLVSSLHASSLTPMLLTSYLHSPRISLHLRSTVFSLLTSNPNHLYTRAYQHHLCPPN
jgi:hypothetical protein